MKVTIDGVDYAMPAEFTYDEMTIMERVSTLTARELYDALDRRSTSAGLAFAACALYRDDPQLGWREIKEQLGTLKLGSITLDFRPDVEEEDSPPAGAA